MMGQQLQNTAKLKISQVLFCSPHDSNNSWEINSDTAVFAVKTAQFCKVNGALPQLISVCGDQIHTPLHPCKPGEVAELPGWLSKVISLLVMKNYQTQKTNKRP